MGAIQSSINNAISTIRNAKFVKSLDPIIKQAQLANLAEREKQAFLGAIKGSQLAVNNRYEYLKANPNLGGFGNNEEFALKQIAATHTKATEAGLKGTDKELKALDLLDERQHAKVSIEQEFDEARDKILGGNR